jgi:penicillin-binding protein 1A
LTLRASEDKLPDIEEKYSVTQNTNPTKQTFLPEKETSFGEKWDRFFNIEDAVAEKRTKIRRYVLFKDIPRALRQAIVAVEDKRFYAHSGFDIESIARATVVNVEAGEIEEGGSTITQQLAKNLFLTQERSFTRKVEELLLAIQLENHFDKNKILEMYLNTIYFGSNFYGIYEASHGYFDKAPADLTVAECAMLAGIPNAPSVYSPYSNFMLAKKRQLVVIDAMVKAHFLSNYDAEKARVDEINLSEGVY